MYPWGPIIYRVFYITELDFTGTEIVFDDRSFPKWEVELLYSNYWNCIFQTKMINPFLFWNWWVETIFAATNVAPHLCVTFTRMIAWELIIWHVLFWQIIFTLLWLGSELKKKCIFAYIWAFRFDVVLKSHKMKWIKFTGFFSIVWN